MLNKAVMENVRDMISAQSSPIEPIKLAAQCYESLRAEGNKDAVRRFRELLINIRSDTQAILVACLEVIPDEIPVADALRKTWKIGALISLAHQDTNERLSVFDKYLGDLRTDPKEYLQCGLNEKGDVEWHIKPPEPDSGCLAIGYTFETNEEPTNLHRYFWNSYVEELIMELELG